MIKVSTFSAGAGFLFALTSLNATDSLLRQLGLGVSACIMALLNFFDFKSLRSVSIRFLELWTIIAIFPALLAALERIRLHAGWKEIVELAVLCGVGLFLFFKADFSKLRVILSHSSFVFLSVGLIQIIAAVWTHFTFGRLPSQLSFLFWAISMIGFWLSLRT